MNDLITNGAEIKQRIISEINNANQSIYLAMAYFTDREIAMAIIDANKRNVMIDIILSSNAQNEIVKLMFKGADVSVHAFETGDPRGIMHHKFCLIDIGISINGSYNYSLNASTNNVENITVSDDSAIYTQFLAEFERLKDNIDNQIAINKTESKTQPNVAPPIIPHQPMSFIDDFSKQLHNLVYSATDIDTEIQKERGYNISKESRGNIDIFRTECDDIKEKIRNYASDDGLGSKKDVLVSDISIAFEGVKSKINAEKQEKISTDKRSNELNKKQIIDKKEELEQQKYDLESGNKNTSEKGLIQINQEIEKNSLELKTIEQSFDVKKFWNVGTVLTMIGLGIFTFYLSVFFASAMYKVFFEGNIIRDSLQMGVNPGIPQLVDANAIVKIFRQEGPMFGFIAALFFLIPVLMSNLKILGSDNKVINTIMFWIGLLIFDILVSTMVTLNTDEIKCLLVGKESTMKIWEVLKHTEFYLIFVFGMFPLILTHFIIDKLTNAYNLSQRDIVDASKNRKLKFLQCELIDLGVNKSELNKKVEQKDLVIQERKNDILNLESEANDNLNQVENTYSLYINQITSVFDDYNARIKSGRIFTDEIFNMIISAFRSGFIEYLPEYYSNEEVTVRVKEIEQLSKAQ